MIHAHPSLPNSMHGYIYRDGLVDYLTNFKFSVVKMISSCKLYRSTLAVAGSDHKWSQRPTRQRLLVQLGFLLGKFSRLDQAMDYSRLIAELSCHLLMALSIAFPVAFSCILMASQLSIQNMSKHSNVRHVTWMQAQLPVFSKAPSTIRALPISGASWNRWPMLAVVPFDFQVVHPGHCRCRLGIAVLGRWSGHYPPGNDQS